MQYFTGSKAHNIALRDRAIERGLKLNEYGLFRVDDDSRVAGETEEGIYEALGLAWIPPELRENRGEIEAAAAAARCPRLITRADLRGDLHMHTTATDGRDDLETMAAAAQRRRARVHRHHRSQQGAGDGQRPRRDARARARGARSARSNGRIDGI